MNRVTSWSFSDLEYLEHQTSGLAWWESLLEHNEELDQWMISLVLVCWRVVVYAAVVHGLNSWE